MIVENPYGQGGIVLFGSRWFGSLGMPIVCGRRCRRGRTDRTQWAVGRAVMRDMDWSQICPVHIFVLINQKPKGKPVCG